MNKKAEFSMAGWVFGIIFIMVLLIILGTQVLKPMNEKYSKNFSTGLSTDYFSELKNETLSASDTIEGGEAEQTDDGLSLKESWSVTKTLYSASTDFISGAFINNLLTDVVGLPEEVGIGAQIIFIASLIFIVIYLFMKVRI